MESHPCLPHYPTATVRRQAFISSYFIDSYPLLDNPKVSLHGGPKGLDDVDWEILDPFSAQLFSDSEKISIGSMATAAVFRYISEDGDQGFPGKLLIEVLVGLLNPGQGTAAATSKDEYCLGSITFVYRAKLLDEGKKVVTPVNLTQVLLKLLAHDNHWNYVDSTGDSISKPVSRRMTPIKQ